MRTTRRQPARGRTAPPPGRCAVLLAACLPLLLAASPATATASDRAPGPPVTGVVVRAEDGTASSAVVVEALVPGQRRQLVVLLDGPGAPAATALGLEVTDLVDDDRGCGRPEQAAGDTSCGVGGGELSERLDVVVVPGREVRVRGGGRGCLPAGAPVTATTLAALEGLPVTVTAARPAARPVCVVLELEQPSRADDNVTQSDTSRFDLRLTVDRVPVGGTVPPRPPGDGGPSAGPSAGPGRGRPVPVAAVRPVVPTGVVAATATGTLASTGASGVVLLLGTGAGLLLLGLVLLVSPRRPGGRGRTGT